MHLIFGENIGLPLVTQMGVVQGHAAQRITWHAHRGFEILFLLEGATSYEFRGGKSVEIPGGQFLVIPPNTQHRGAHDVRMPSTICGIVLHPEPETQAINTPFAAGDLRWIAGQLNRSALTVTPYDPDLRQIMTRLAATELLRTGKLPESGPDGPRAALTVRWLACAAIAETARGLLARKSSSPTMFVTAAAEYLRQHYQEPVTMPDLIKRLGFGRARMFQLFKEGMGLTPNDYLQRIRVEKAQECLRATQKPVTEIALESGFNSSQYFSTVFRRYTGLSPSGYREKFSQHPPPAGPDAP